jgi:hypothetical protein
MQNSALCDFFSRMSGLHNAHFDVVLRKPIFELQACTERIHKAWMLGI